MWFFFVLAWVFSRCDSVFNIAFPFLDSHGVVEILEHFGIGAMKERKKEEGGVGIKQLQQDSLQVLICMYDFLARFGMHGIACGYLLSWHGFF